MFNRFEYVENANNKNKKIVSFTPNKQGTDIFSFMKVLEKTKEPTIKESTTKVIDTNEIPKELLDGLSEQQQDAFHKIAEGQNVFITGPGGTGKTFMLKRIHKYNNHVGKKLVVTAMTGCAALLLECNAKTLHSWSGIKLAKGPNEEIIEKVLKSGYYKKIGKKLKALSLMKSV